MAFPGVRCGYSEPSMSQASDVSDASEISDVFDDIDFLSDTTDYVSSGLCEKIRKIYNNSVRSLQKLRTTPADSQEERLETSFCQFTPDLTPEIFNQVIIKNCFSSFPVKTLVNISSIDPLPMRYGHVLYRAFDEISHNWMPIAWDKEISAWVLQYTGENKDGNTYDTDLVWDARKGMWIPFDCFQEWIYLDFHRWHNAREVTISAHWDTPMQNWSICENFVPSRDET